MSRISVHSDSGTDGNGAAQSRNTSLIQTAVLDASQDGILVEENERIIFLNESYLKLFGFDDPGELIGQHVSKIISAEDVDRAKPL